MNVRSQWEHFNRVLFFPSCLCTKVKCFLSKEGREKTCPHFGQGQVLSDKSGFGTILVC
jgi:hypothetical protein